MLFKLSDIPDNNYLKRFVGIITENTLISKIRFVFNQN